MRDHERKPAPRRFGERETPGGYLCGEVASALQKTLRRGLEREALHWATELDLAGYGAYVWKRLRIIASEDVGPADSMVAVQVPAFGHLRVGALDGGHVQRYVAAKLAGKPPLAARSVNTHLNVLHLICKAARKRKLLRSNPVEEVDRPAVPRRRWTILTPVEIGRVARAFVELAEQTADDDEERAWLVQARVVFLVVSVLGLRRGEVLGLRWRHVALADPEGARLRVEETWVRGGLDTPKSEASERTIAVGSRLAEELFEHRGRSAFAGEDELVFCHPLKGSPLDHKRYAASLRAAMKIAKVAKPMRPFHDGRHTALTNAAVAGNAPAAIQARAGHADFSTTQRYIDLAGVAFRDEAQAAEDRLLGG